MEQQRLENIDIEKSKELFAYEMTEVILALKGEFASVSGKDLGCAECFVSEEAQNAPRDVLSRAQLPALEVRREDLRCDLPAGCLAPVPICGNLAQIGETLPPLKTAAVLPEVRLPEIKTDGYAAAVQEKWEISVPQAAAAAVSEVQAVTVEKPAVSVPPVAELPKSTIPAVLPSDTKVDVPTVGRFVISLPEKNRELDCGGISGVQAIAPVALPDRKLPEVPAIAILPMAVCAAPVAVPAFSKTSMPRIPSLSVGGGPDIEIPVAEIFLPKLAEFAPERMPAVLEGFSVPAKPMGVSGVIPAVALPGERITLPKVSRCDFPQAVERDALPVPAPEVPDVQRERNEILSAIAEFF